MRKLYRTIVVFCFIVIVTSAILLVTHYDPTHPAHRRYSSEPVITLGTGKEIGDSGERVLSKDLGLPINDKENPRQIICNTRYKEQQSPPRNTVCIFFSDAIVNYRVPDFISLEHGIIADSKNKTQLLDGGREINQIREFAVAAKEMNLSLWLYVRHNTHVDGEYSLITGATGGRVIHYFTTESIHFDIVDKLLIGSMLICLVVLIVTTLVPRLIAFMRPKPTSPIAISEHRTSRKARQSFDDYDDFIRKTGDNARKTLDD